MFRRTLPALACAAALVAVSPVPDAVADKPGGCPDDMVPVPTMLTQGRGDDNRDLIVCGKVKEGKVVGGPDYNPPSGAIVVEILGIEWWIVDNVYDA